MDTPGAPRQTHRMAITLRAVTAADWPLWRELRLAALAEAPHAFTSRLADWHRGGEARWRARLEASGGHHVVALRADRPVGLASGVPVEDGGVAELRSVWVHPEARGHGVGDGLVRAVEGWARRSAFRSLRLSVLPGNDAALALYRRNGFAVTGEPGELLPDGVTRERVLAKPLR